ncbi:hypothetical protein JCM16303_002701 [Sporobolomyces ruberrimus]
MDGDDSVPRSVKDRIALLQQQQPGPSACPSSSSRSTVAPRPPPSPTASSTSPRLASSSHLSNLYNQSSGNTHTTSPVKASATFGHSKVNARPESPTATSHARTRGSSPPYPTRLQDTLAGHIGERTYSPRSQSPAQPPPPLPRRISSPSVDTSSSHTQQLRHRSQTVDPLSSNGTNSSRPRPPQLPPRRSSTLDPLTSNQAFEESTSFPHGIPSTSSTLSSRSISQNSNPPSSSVRSNKGPTLPPARSIPSSTTQSSTSQVPPLPQRKPTLPSSTTSRKQDISPRTPLVSTFQPSAPPLRPRPTISSKPTLNDPLSAPSPPRSSPSRNGNPLEKNNPTRKESSFKIRPIDPRARLRYERLFDQVLDSRVPNRGGEDDEVIEGELVRMIWERSRLSREVLRGVWNEISPKSAQLDKDKFVRGMWIIDEELRRRQRKD